MCVGGGWVGGRVYGWGVGEGGESLVGPGRGWGGGSDLLEGGRAGSEHLRAVIAS